MIERTHRADRLTVPLFGLTLFVNSTLLFLVQPLVAKQMLPVLGGAAAVWTTCMLFFQLLLLAGYEWAHALQRWGPQTGGVLIHAALFLTAVILAPLHFDVAPLADGNPVVWLLRTLTASVGLRFVLLASTAPLLQRWFSRTGHPNASDPYFLYALSNTGSLVALLAYPLMIEPFTTLSQQVRYWNAGFAAAAVLTIACGAAANRSHRLIGQMQQASISSARRAVPWRRRLAWVTLAFVPSSLFLAVTAHLTTDIAAVPLLWVIPLALYLLTFIVAFTRRGQKRIDLAERGAAMASVLLVVLLLSHLASPLWCVIPIHLAGFAVIGLACHGRLARLRPAADHLTSYYLCLAVGGVLGGVFNAIIAPLVFVSTAEYPLALALSCAVRARRSEFVDLLRQPRSLAPALSAGLISAAAPSVVRSFALPPGYVVALLAAAALICYGMSRRPAAFASGIALMLGAGALQVSPETKLLAERTFYGVYRLVLDGNHRVLYSGTTVHGVEQVGGSARPEPLGYFHRRGPVGDIFDVARQGRPMKVGVVGLGAGTLAGYGEAGDMWTFYEIDPAVERIARDRQYFTYLARSPARCTVIVGDGRVSLRDEHPTPAYDLIVIDAFSSDAIPTHLLTREALALYFSRLAKRGLIAFHVSNRHLRLTPVLARVAADAGAPALVKIDAAPLRGTTGRYASEWFVITQNDEAVSALRSHAGWERPARNAVKRVWTDDYSDLLSTIVWR